MYAITGATGKVGKILVNELLSKGKKVKAIGRDSNRLTELVNKGATALVGDVTNPDFVKNAFTNAEAVLLIIPENNVTNDYRADARRITKYYVESVKANNIKNVVLLSSIGAQLGRNGGIDERLFELERQFADVKNINILNIRSAFHMENILNQVDMVIQMGKIGSPLKPNVLMPAVCTDDVGLYAAKRLIELNFKGNTTEYILGQRDVTPLEITNAIGKAIGKPDLQYVQLKNEDFIKAFKQIGFSENVARGIYEWGEALNSGKETGYFKRTPKNTTTTTIEQFAETFAKEYSKHQVTI